MTTPTSIIITGASSGIGRACALALADWNGPLILSGRSTERLQATLESVENLGGRGIIHVADLSDTAAVGPLIAAAEAEAPIYALVHAGGSAISGAAHEQDPAVWAAQIDLNLAGAYRLTQRVLEQLLPRRRGHLVYLNSVAGLQGFPNSSAYVAAKHGLRGLAQAVREEVREQQISVTSIFPGATATEWWDKQSGDFPLEQMLSPEAVGKAVAFVLSLEPPAVVEELVMRHQGGDF